MNTDAALAELCGEGFVEEQAGTRRQEEVLRTLIPLTRTEEGRARIGGTANALKNLVGILSDRHVYLNDAGAIVVRLLRNLCARNRDNQTALADLDAHGKVLDCIEKRLDRPANGVLARIADTDAARLKMPFFGFAVEFLVNFATNHVENAGLVWERCFPIMFCELLECANPAASSAAAVLVHNCVACLPERIIDVVKIWDGDGKTSIARSILSRANTADDDDFLWCHLVVKRLVEANLLSKAFIALGPPLCAVLSDKDKDWSSAQESLLHILEEALAKSAKRPSRDPLDVRLPDESLSFVCELLESSVLKGKGSVMRSVLSIAGSVIIMSDESDGLASLRMTTAKTGIETLRIAGKQAGGAKSVDVQGLRGAAVRAVALACDDYEPAQSLVRNSNGLPHVLNALSYEADATRNPFLREWAILAVRNLCKDNAENCAAMSEYELQGVQTDNELLEKAGLEAYVDKTSGKVKIRSKTQ